MKTLVEDLTEESARRRGLARSCRARAGGDIRQQAKQDYVDAARHDQIADEIDEMLLTMPEKSSS